MLCPCHLAWRPGGPPDPSGRPIPPGIEDPSFNTVIHPYRENSIPVGLGVSPGFFISCRRNTMSNQNTTPKYFDLHSTGVGYLNRVRLVKPERGNPFLAVDISALHGSIDNVEYTRFDCRVSGSAAKDAIMALKDVIEDKDTKVLVGFKLGDLYAEPFTYKRGQKAGQTGISLKARLLQVHWAKVNGEKYALPNETTKDHDNRQPAVAAA
jgi:hypothetical protein